MQKFFSEISVRGKTKVAVGGEEKNIVANRNGNLVLT